MTWSSMAHISSLWRFLPWHHTLLRHYSLWSIVFEKTVDLSAPPLLDQPQDLPTQPSLSTGGLAGESLCWGRAAVWRETGDPIRLRVRLHGPPSPMPPMHTQAQPFLDPLIGVLPMIANPAKLVKLPLLISPRPLLEWLCFTHFLFIHFSTKGYRNRSKFQTRNMNHASSPINVFLDFDSIVQFCQPPDMWQDISVFGFHKCTSWVTQACFFVTFTIYYYFLYFIIPEQ